MRCRTTPKGTRFLSTQAISGSAFIHHYPVQATPFIPASSIVIVSNHKHGLVWYHDGMFTARSRHPYCNLSQRSVLSIYEFDSFSILSLRLFVNLDYIISCLTCHTKVFTSLNFLPKLRREFYILYVQYYFTNVYIAIFLGAF